MNENPYRAPQSHEAGPRNGGWIPDRPSWGCVALIWPLGYIFALVWLVGSLAMYATLIGLWIHLERTIPPSGMTPPQPYYDLAGVVIFGTCALAALVAAVVLIVRRKGELRRPWPDWRMALRRLLWSTLIVGPAWALLAWTGGGLHVFPGESAWIGISEVALLGIVHGWICQQGWGYHRPDGSAIAKPHP